VPGRKGNGEGFNVSTHSSKAARIYKLTDRSILLVEKEEEEYVGVSIGIAFTTLLLKLPAV